MDAIIYMQRAIELAKIGAQQGEVPVGAVIVNARNGEVIAETHNQCEALQNSTMHAEMVAIKNACSKLGSKFLNACHIYVTLEPCLMCATALSYARVARIYYGAADQKFGAIESGSRIFCSQSALYKPDVYSGILEEESRILLKEFFTNLR